MSDYLTKIKESAEYMVSLINGDLFTELADSRTKMLEFQS
jgi:hypothetical protein